MKSLEKISNSLNLISELDEKIKQLKKDTYKQAYDNSLDELFEELAPALDWEKDEDAEWTEFLEDEYNLELPCLTYELIITLFKINGYNPKTPKEFLNNFIDSFSMPERYVDSEYCVESAEWSCDEIKFTLENGWWGTVYFKDGKAETDLITR